MKIKQKLKILVGVGVLFFFSCTTLHLKKETKINIVKMPVLGNVGLVKGDVFAKTFHAFGQPTLKVKIKVSLREILYDTKRYKTYRKFIENQGKKTTISYSDSIVKKPTYFELTILDRVTLTKELNSKENKDLQEYLQKDASYKMVTKVDFNVSEIQKSILQNAQEMYLVQDGTHNLGLELMTEGKVSGQIHFADIETFAFKTSSFCWGMDKFYRAEIQVLVEGNKCPSTTYRRSKKAKKEKEYLKF